MMSKEKQIEEMAKDVASTQIGTVKPDLTLTELGEVYKGEFILRIAKHLYNAGYRKQSEGEWHYNPNGMDWGLGAWECSLCRCRNDNLPMDKNIKPLAWAGTKYCPNCGAKMKGGAE